MNEKITKAIDEMLDEENALSPVSATFKGVHDYDELWDDPSPDGIAVWEDHINRYRREFDRVAASAAGEDAVDVALARAHLARLEVLIKDLDEARRNPLNVPATVVQGIFIMMTRNYAPFEERLGAARARLEKVPAYCAAAKKSFARPVERFTAYAAEMAGHGAAFLAQVVPQAASDAKSKHAVALAKWGEKAAAALDDFVQHVKSLPQDENFAAGEAAFDRLLREYHLLDFNASSLRAFGEEEFAKVEAEMKTLAEKIKPGGTIAEALAEAKKEHPPAEKVLDFYREWMARSREFVVAKDLCALPPDEVLEVIPTPTFERPFIPYAAYMPAAPYEKDQRGFFYVTPVDETAPPEQQKQKLEGHNRAKVQLVALHEGYPGHHLQLCWANRVARRMRREFHSTPFVEGWALYCEEMMREEGFFTDDLAVLSQKRDTLWRAARVIIDASLHTEKMTFDEAVRFLADKVGIEEVNAVAEVKRYSYTPTQPMSYLVGAREILRLREDFARANPAAPRRAFHDRLLRAGSLPLPLARAVILG